MDILVKGLASGYDIEHLVRIFYPGAAVRGENARCTKGTLVLARAGSRRLAAAVRTADGAVRVLCTARAQAVQQAAALSGLNPAAPAAGEKPDAALRLALSRLVYRLLCEVCGMRPPWGMLTGVRPLNLLRKKLKGGEDAAYNHLVTLCDVSPEKYAIACEIEKAQRPLLAQSTPQSYSLYISIPFCPSRCAYCSFVSQTVEREGGLIAPYLEKLEEELAATARAAAASGLKLETIYIGGGTPTALNEAQFERLLAAVQRYFDTKAVAEYTVEAGRPDCTTPAKLQAMKAYGVTRVSINPQTMRDDVLQRIGRRHTAQDVVSCFELARKAGHANINMDLIAGLPGDDAAGFLRSVQQVAALSPENITLHSLTLKRTSRLARQQNDAAWHETAPQAVLEKAYTQLREAGYGPYYLYRQKSGVDHLENTGWAKPGFEGLYNLYIMEETHTILAAGAGASTKFVLDGGQTIRRVYNPRLSLEYIRAFDDVRARKEEGVKQHYAGNLDP